MQQGPYLLLSPHQEGAKTTVTNHIYALIGVKMAEATARCPFCGEKILDIAVKCKHCQSMIDRSPGTAPGREQESRRLDNMWNDHCRIFVLCLAVVLVLGSACRNESKSSQGDQRLGEQGQGCEQTTDCKNGLTCSDRVCRASEGVSPILALGQMAVSGLQDIYPSSEAWTAPVMDLANVIPEDDEERMNQFVKVLQKQTGSQIAVYTLDSLEGRDPGQVATEMANRWGVGDEAKDNGVLVLVAVGDRKDFTATGRGLEDVLPDSFVGSLRRKVLVPAFRAGNYGQGLRQYMYELSLRIVSQEESPPGELSKDFEALLDLE
jgi:hypothetical protein